MARLRRNFMSGTITDNPLLIGATTINSANFANLPVVASPDIIALVLDPLGTAGTPEIVYVTAHTAAATSVTALRGQETALGGGAARQHAQGIPWILAETAASAYEKTLLGTSSARPASPTQDMLLRETDTGLLKSWNGSNWVTERNLKVLNIGSAYVGSPPAVDTGSLPFLLQVGTIVFTSDANGYQTVTFPTAFPNGLIAAFVVAASGGAGTWWAIVTDAAGSLSSFQLRCLNTAGALANSLVRCNWMAYGF